MKKIEEMTLREKIGQLVMLGFNADDVDGMVEMIENDKVGNVILFANNIKDSKSLFEMNQKLQQKAIEKLGVPLFISVDQEGGMVTRILKNATFFPGNMTLAATNNSENAYLSAKIMGKELKNLGINMNLAPVLDVNNNPKNPVIGVRSYSDSPEVVAEYGVQAVKGLQENNVIATGKHFPGHGDTSVDSHLDLSSVAHDRDRLEKVELYPFKKAIENGIGAIMSAHVLFPAYEPDHLPGTLSHHVLTGLLRNQLGFEGLIVTDCLEMKAIDTYYTTEKAAVMALQAGATILCISHTKSRQLGAIEEIVRAVEEGQLDVSVIDDAVRRVLDSKQQVQKDVEIFIHQQFEDIQGEVGTKEHKAFAQGMADQALTLVSGKPFSDPKKSTLCIAPKPKATTIADDEVGGKSLLDAIENHFTDWTTIEIPVNPSEEVITELLSKVNQFEQVVLCTYNANIYLNQRVLLEKISEQKEELYCIALRNPYDLMNLNVNGVCTFEYTSLAVKTVIKYLEGQLQPTGKLPVKLA